MAIPKNYPDTSTPLTAEFLLNYCHPIGEVFFTEDDNFNPNNEWGGTWELDTDGIVYGSKSNSSSSMFNTTTGTIIGEEKHTLTTGELPSMSFSIPHIEYSDALWQSSNITLKSKTGQGGSGFKDSGARANANEGKLKEYSWGSNTPHNNVQKTRICNIWRRIA